MKNLTFILVSVVFAFGLKAQNTPPSIQWEKSLGGTYNEYATSVKQTNDRGYIVAGWSFSNDGDVTGHHGSTGTSGTCDYWIVKLDSAGNIKWEKSLGGTGTDRANSIQQTADGGYIVAGYSNSNNGDVTGHHGNAGGYQDNDYWVVKLDSAGNIKWEKSLGGTDNDIANSIQQTTDGGYIIAGASRSIDGDVTGNNGFSDYWLVKLDTTGNILWQKCLGGSNNDEAYSIGQTLDRGFIATGYSMSNDSDVTGNHIAFDYWVVKTDTVGNIQWQKSLGGSGNDYGQSIQQTNDGGYIAGGSSNSINGNVTGNNGGWDYWTVKLDTAGNIQWEKSYGGSNSDYAYSNSILETIYKSYLIAGYTYSNNGNVSVHYGNSGEADYWILSLDVAGNLLWQKTLGGSFDDYAQSIQATTDGGYIVAGTSFSSDSDVTSHHGTPGNYGYGDYWVVKLAPPPLNVGSIKIKPDVSIYPNPSNRNIIVNVPDNTKYIEISNSIGQVLEKRNVVHQTKLNFIIKENGVYFVQIVTNNESMTKKIIINK
jgi:hypothetical protein